MRGIREMPFIQAQTPLDSALPDFHKDEARILVLPPSSPTIDSKALEAICIIKCVCPETPPVDVSRRHGIYIIYNYDHC